MEVAEAAAVAGGAEAASEAEEAAVDLAEVVVEAEAVAALEAEEVASAEGVAEDSTEAAAEALAGEEVGVVTGEVVEAFEVADKNIHLVYTLVRLQCVLTIQTHGACWRPSPDTILLKWYIYWPFT